MIGRTISHYKILEKLGEGGMGVVYKAEDTNLTRTVALKFLPEQVGASQTDRARLLLEARSAATLNHPNICTIHAIEEHDGQLFIDMEFVDGETLRHKLPIRKFDDAIAYAIQIGEALQEAHSKGIVHRDIKSDNIIVNSKSQVKVMDFGLAKLKGSARLTKTNSTVGTLAYMAPEQILGEEVDNRTDIWSLGVVLYEMLTGQLPFRGVHEAAIMYEILNLEPKAMEFYRTDVPENTRVLLSQLLEKNRSKRISSIREVIIRLKNRDQQEPASTPDKSIAVLYFESMSSEKESDYFCAGITEDIITDLSKIKELKVVSRTDVVPFRNKEVNTQQVGDALGVNYILEGSVRKAGNKIRITAQLIDVRNGFHVWAERFDRLVEDIFDLQTEVSLKIAEALKVSLTTTEEQSLAAKPTDDLRAYDFYMRGRDLLSRQGKKNSELAIQMFENSLSIDPRFASAYAGLGEAYSNMYEWYDGSPAWLGKAIEMNQKALSLDPSSIEARFGIAMVYFHQRRFTDSKRTLEGILQENSDFYDAHFRLGMILESSGDLDSARTYYERASVLKPYDEDPWMRLDGIYRKTGDSQSADEAARKVIEIASRKLEVSRDDLIVMSRLAEAYARFGLKEESYATLRRVFEIDPTDGLALYNCSCAYALLGEKHEALVCLRRAIESGFRAVANRTKTDPDLVALRNDQEFMRLIAEFV